MVVVSLLSGHGDVPRGFDPAFEFAAALGFHRRSSYGIGTESGDLVFTKELRLDVRGRDVITRG